MMTDLHTAVRFLPALVIGITVHEFAHAFSASRLGDDFARRQGRVSLNPLRHLAPLGTLVIFFLPFGWGRPVPVNLYNFKRPKRDYLLTSLAGPAANVIMAAVILPLTYLTCRTLAFGPAGEAKMTLAHDIAANAFIFNLIVATFNLLPIPPLDGSKIWPCLIPGLKPAFSRKLMLLFMGITVFLLWTGRLTPVIRAVVGPAAGMLPQTDRQVFDRQLARGRRACEAGRYGQAVAALDAAIRIDPLSDNALCWRAHALGVQEKWKAATADMNRAIELNGADPDHYEQRAWLHESQGQTDEARTDRENADLVRGALAGIIMDLAAAREANAPVLKGLALKLPKMEVPAMVLGDVLQFIGSAARVAMDVDWEALAERGVSRSTPVTMSTQEQSARETIKMALEFVSTDDDPISYGVSDGKIVIPDRMGPRPLTRPAR
ncbi:MAG: site-2 protease family protein [Planctomycetota bacterium]|jgi:Zn-dependent protease